MECDLHLQEKLSREDKDKCNSLYHKLHHQHWQLSISLPSTLNNNTGPKEDILEKYFKIHFNIYKQEVKLLVNNAV